MKRVTYTITYDERTDLFTLWKDAEAENTWAVAQQGPSSRKLAKHAFEVLGADRVVHDYHLQHER